MGREIGTLLGDYRIVDRLGAGACGEIFKVEHVITHRIEAVKLLSHGQPVTAEDERRFSREIELQAGLHHPNIAAVLNACSTPEGLALVMELVDGEPLAALLARRCVPLDDGIRYMLQTLDALGYAHAHGVVHQDVKPGNILITTEGSVKLTDFGLARAHFGPESSTSGAPAGSPYYMSPEQVLGAPPADARSDFYSAGVVLYEIATGRRPFEAQSSFDVMLQQREAVPIPPISIAPQIGPALNQVILKAMEKDPARRFQSAVEFHAALERVFPFPALAPAATHRPPRKFRTAAYSATAAAALCIVAGFALLAGLLRPTVVRPPQPVIRPIVAQPPAPVIAAPEQPAPPPVPVAPVLPQKAIEKPPVTRHASAPRALRSPGESTAIAIAPPEPAPDPKPEKAADIPLPPPPSISAPAAQPPVATPPGIVADGQADTPPPEPPKRHHFLRRAWDRIVHTRAGEQPQEP